MRFFTLFKTWTESIKYNWHHLLKIDRFHIIAISSKSLKWLKLVFILHNWAKNQLETFSIVCTNIWPSFILLPPRKWYFFTHYASVIIKAELEHDAILLTRKLFQSFLKLSMNWLVYKLTPQRTQAENDSLFMRNSCV